jgi:alkylhydroperoxidase family enzyme
MTDTKSARDALVARILTGDGRASRADRRAAFDNAGLAGPLHALIDKVVKRAHQITDADIAAVRAAGLGEDAIFEIVVCGAIGEATRQSDAAFAALDAATKQG